MKQTQTAEERNEKVAKAQEALAAGLAKLVSGEDWKALLASVASNVRRRLSPARYSFRNQVIVMIEGLARGVDAGAVGTFRAWKDVGRSVKKGEKAVYVLQPRVWKREVENRETGEREEKKGVFFRALPVFLLGQTEGAELPAAPSLVGEIEDDARFAEHLAALSRVALALPDAPVASFEVRARRAEDPAGALGWYVRGARAIVVVESGNRAQMFKTAVHEVAHAILHGVDHHGYAHNEVEAESVAFVVASAFGLDVSGYSFPYVATWASRNDAEKDAAKLVVESGERIARAANLVLDALLGPVEPAEEEPETAAA